MTGLAAGTGRSLRAVRTTLELAVLAAGIALGGTFGTLVYALAIGPLWQLFVPLLTVPAASAPRTHLAPA
jgi:uncharacterized membrane protein YczE